MKALGHFVVLKKLKQEATKIGGLEITESQDKDMRYVVGEIVSLGSFVNSHAKDDSEKIKVGDKVKYDSRAGHKDEVDGEIYWIIKADSIAYVI